MLRRGILVLAMTLFAAAFSTARADEVTDQLDTARKAYEAGELRSAVQALQFAVAKIQEEINASLTGLLPRPLEGWTADEPEAQSGGIAAMIAGTTLTRRYHRTDGAEVEINIIADSPLLPMMTMMLSSPMLLQSDPNTKLYTYDGQRGLVEHEKDSRRWEIKLMVGNKILVQITATGVKTGAGGGLPEGDRPQGAAEGVCRVRGRIPRLRVRKPIALQARLVQQRRSPEAVLAATTARAIRNPPLPQGLGEKVFAALPIRAGASRDSGASCSLPDSPSD